MSTQPGKIQLHHLPASINEYIREHFYEDFLAEIREQTGKDGLYYEVDITKDEILHHLVFNKEGHLISSNSEPLFPQDPHEDFFTGDEPDPRY